MQATDDAAPLPAARPGGIGALGRRIRGALGVSAVAAVGMSVVGTITLATGAVLMGSGISLSNILTGALTFAGVGFGAGLIGSIAIALASLRQGTISKSTAFSAGAAATGVVYAGIVGMQWARGFTIEWGGTLFLMALVCSLVGLGAAAFVEIWQRPEEGPQTAPEPQV